MFYSRDVRNLKNVLQFEKNLKNVLQQACKGYRKKMCNKIYFVQHLYLEVTER